LSDQQQAQEAAAEVVEGRLAVGDLRNPAPLITPTMASLFSSQLVTGAAEPGEEGVEAVTSVTNFALSNPLLLIGLLLVIIAGTGGAVWQWRRRHQ